MRSVLKFFLHLAKLINAMKKLFFLTVTILALSFSGCDKESVESKYIVAVTAENYSDELMIMYQSNLTYQQYDPDKNMPFLDLSNGEAVIEAYKKDEVKFHFKAYPTAPPQQVQGYTIHMDIYVRKSNGSKGNKVAGFDLSCGVTSSEGTIVVNVES